jgi:7-cyano-7-deazaguanine synthase
MCSINGFAKLGPNNYSVDNHEKLKEIILCAEDRGRDSFGFSFINYDGSIRNHRFTVKPSDILGKEHEWDIPYLGKVRIVLNNNRAEPTTEFVLNKKIEDVQPYVSKGGKVYVVHNGTISNDKELIAKYDLKPLTAIDSAVIPELLEQLWDGRDEVALRNILIDELVGSYALAIYHTDNPDKIFFANNYKPLYLCFDSFTNVLYFSSFPEYMVEDVNDIFDSRKLVEVKPYTLLSVDLMSKETKRQSLYKVDSYTNIKPKKALIIASSGLDSTVCISWAKSKGYDVSLLHYDYHCRAEEAETRSMKAIADYYDAELITIPTDIFKNVIKNSRLTDENATINKDRGGIAGAELAIEWVPARNLIFMSIAAGYAEAYKFDYIILGGNLEESGCLLDVKDNAVRMFNKESGGTGRMKGKKMPSQIKLGDELLSWNFESNKLEKTIVTDLYKPVHKKYLEIICKGRKFKNRKQEEVRFQVSKEHPFYIKNKGFTVAENLEQGDVIMRVMELKQSELQSNAKTNNGAFKNGNLIGAKNPMFGHKRDGSVCHCGVIHFNNPEKIKETMEIIGKDQIFRKNVSEGVIKMLSSNIGQDVKNRISKSMKIVVEKRLKKIFEETGYTHWNQIPEIARKLSISISLAIKEGRINPAANQEVPTKIEKRFIEFFERNNLSFDYKGDGSIWLTSKGKHMNPDFVDLKNKKIIEVTTKGFMYHTEKEKMERKELYRNIGWDMLYLTDVDLIDENATILLIEQFSGSLVNGLEIEQINIIEKEVQTYNFHCSPNNNYFIGQSGVLTHNSYADNEAIFQRKFNDLLPNSLNLQAKVEVLTPVANLMKREIVDMGLKLNAPLHLTWSCYENGTMHCGECGPDHMRKTAFKMLGVKEVVPYMNDMDGKYFSDCAEVQNKYPNYQNKAINQCD